MLTGIRVITLLELTFWFIRLISRRCFKSRETNYEFPERKSNPGRQRMEALEKRNEAIEKEMRTKISVIEKRLSRQLKPGGKVIRTRKWPSIKVK